MAAIGRVLLIPKGDYSGSTAYNALDWVRDNGAAWVCKVDNTIGIAPPALPTTSNANWQVLAEDGTVSGSVAWTSVNNKPFDDVDTTDDFQIDSTGGSNELQIKRGTFGTVRVVSDSGVSPTTTNLEASGDAIIKFKGGTNVTLSADDSATPKEITINASGGGTGGHTMLPDPTSSPAPTEDTVVTTINTKVATEGGANDDVASLFGIASWSNTMTKTYLVKGIAGSGTPIGTGGIGDWDDESTYDGWIGIPALYGIGAVGKENIHVKITYDPAKSDTVVLGGWKIEDNTTMTDHGGNTVNCGKICVKFATNLSDADIHTAVVGIEISIKRTETVDVSTL